MNSKVKKVLFILTFIPYALVLLSGLTGAIFGVGFFFDTVYGLDGFLLSVIFALYAMVMVVPVIPICIVFHILCLLRKKVPFIKKISIKKFALFCTVLFLVVSVPLLLNEYSYEIEKMFEKANAKQMSARADDKIAFNLNTVRCDGIFNMPEYKTNHILIDYDKNKVGFLINASYDEYFEIDLAETSPDSSEYRHIADTYFVQADIPLSSPGKRLICFFDEERNSHRTIAMLLFYEDGSIFYADEMREKDTNYEPYTGLRGSEYYVFEESLKLADYENMNNIE